jgi:diguanylate cyclase (GGDEF)-like protein
MSGTAPSGEPSAASAGRRRSVLIVDDDPVFGLLATETLEQAGFAARLAGTAAEAFVAFAAERPELILLDVDLPDSNGFDLCAKLRALCAPADVPIVMVTGHDDTGSIARAYEVGATDFIHKPVLWPTLPHRVGFMLRAVDSMGALRLSEQKNRALLQALPDTIMVVGGNGVLLEHITGSEARVPGNFVGKSLEEVLPAKVARAARACMSSGTTDLSTYEFEVGRGSERRWFEARLLPRSGGPLLIVTRDTTERRIAKARIEYLAYYDVLTKLPNRQLFVREAAAAMQEAKRAGHLLALLYLDLDRFKRINDNLGHSVGDALLQSVARRLEASVNAPDITAQGTDGAPRAPSRVARLGGDEFVVLLTGLKDEEQAVAVAERVTRSLGEPFECGGHRFVVTPSIGIAMYPKDATDVDDLLIKADMAMYQAKDRGRNGHVFFGHSMAVRSLGRLQLENDLRRAFERSEFRIHYQPKMDVASGTIVGAEALLRWSHPTRGEIPPDTFIPVAEETGLIVQLGDWVIRQACKQLKAWSRQDLGALTIAVNVSVQQFSRDDFLDSVLRAVRHYAVTPQQLELEITESLLMRHVSNTAAYLKRFRGAGIALSIDDFGTGYSSLGYLRQFPVDALKIDRSFVRDLHTSDDDAAICAAIIAMARELKLKVVAEGVENVEQLEFLRRHRCDQVQGYLIGRPVAIGELDALLRRSVRVEAPRAPGVPESPAARSAGGAAP